MGVIEIFDQNSSFFGLKSNGAGWLTQAQSKLLSASDWLDKGINFLKNESDNQSDDIIKINDTVDEADLDSILVYIDDFNQAITGEYSYTADWDDNWNTPDAELTFGLDNFFQGDFLGIKHYLPAYTVYAERDTIDWDYDYNYFSEPCSDTVNVNYYGYYYFDYYEYYSDGDIYGPYESGNVVIDNFKAAADSIFSQYITYPNLSYLEVYVYWSGYLYPGLNTIYDDIYVYVETEEPDNVIYSPVITWDANNFNQWIFPDPTIGGLFPEIGSDAEFKSIFGIDASDWQKVVKL